MEARGWDELDVLLITGDAYVDHPAFGAAVIGRVLEAAGYRVGIVAQPSWGSTADIASLGRPRLFVGVTAGATDSMVALRTPHRKKRGSDRMSPGGRAGLRPPRATLVYANLVKQAFGDTVVVLGGVEASLRRFSHYDFWQDGIRRSFLLDTKADLLVYGMGERAAVEIARRLAAGRRDLTEIPSTCFARKATAERVAAETKTVELPSHEEVESDPGTLCAMAEKMERSLRKRPPSRLVQRAGDLEVVQVPPLPVDSGRELDRYYELGYTRRAHPSYREPIPALETVRWSLTSHRGCFGGCSFCSVAMHEGWQVASRTRASLVREARELARAPGFPGVIADVGGPTANMYRMGCKSGARGGRCERVSCLHPNVCPHLNTDHSAWMEMLQALRKIENVSQVRVASGLRHDILPEDEPLIARFCRHHVAGRVRLAPEHGDGKVLELMRKPRASVFSEVVSRLRAIARSRGSRKHPNSKTRSRQPKRPHPSTKPSFELEIYLMTAFPGSTAKEKSLLSKLLSQWGVRAYDVQCFTPTPLTAATAMYAAGTDLRGKPLQVVRSDRGRKRSTLIEPRGAGKVGGRRQKRAERRGERRAERRNRAKRTEKGSREARPRHGAADRLTARGSTCRRGGGSRSGRSRRCSPDRGSRGE
jgi:uncharacterized radical SAM protein YgiQ